MAVGENAIPEPQDSPDKEPKGGKKKSPSQKRAETEAQRKEWTQEEIDEAIAANGGTPKSQTPPARGPGRPSKYPTIDLERVEMYAAGGLTKYEIAEAVGISIDTLMEYQKQYPEFSAAIESGRTLRAQRAEISLHKSAAGHYAREEKLHYDQQVGKWVRETTLKYYPPDTKANLAILQHAETGSWKPKSDLEVRFPEPTIIRGPDGKVVETLGPKPGDE